MGWDTPCVGRSPSDGLHTVQPDVQGILCGAAAYLLRRRGALTAQDQKSVTNVLMRFVVYFTVIMSSQQDFSLKAAKAILVTAIYAVLFFAVFIPASIFLSRRLKLEEAKRRVFVCSLVFCNITFIGYPILQELYGNIGLLCAIVFSMIYNVVFYSWGMFYLGDRGRGSLRSILTNKIALASVLALVMYFLQIKIPEPLYSTFNGIGALTMPLSMIIIGCSLADSGICKILRDRTLYLPTVLRMAVMPAVVCLVMRLLVVDPEIIRISTVIAALPSGTMTSIVAADYGCAPDYAANIMVQTMLAMLAALPAWVFLVGM